MASADGPGMDGNSQGSACRPDRLLLGFQGAAGERKGPAAPEGEATEGTGGEEKKGTGVAGVWGFGTGEP